MAKSSAESARHRLEPFSNAVVLPVFVFVAALVSFPKASELGPVFWAILVSLPVGKLIGITGGALIAMQLSPRATRTTARKARLPLWPHR